MKKPLNAGTRYTDTELISILSDAPTQYNAVKHAALHRRSVAAISLVYQFAMAQSRDVTPGHACVRRIKQIAGQLGWLQPFAAKRGATLT